MCAQENNEGKFVVAPINNGDFLVFPNIKWLYQISKIVFNALVLKNVTIEVHLDSIKGKIPASYRLKKANQKNDYNGYVFDFPEQENTTSLCFVFRGNKNNLMFFDFFQFK